jgi:nitronate monooxygenase
MALEVHGRHLGHPYPDRWRGREAELAADPAATRQAYEADVARGAVPPSPVRAGEAVGLVTEPPPATALVSTLTAEAEAEAALARAAGR